MRQDDTNTIFERWSVWLKGGLFGATVSLVIFILSIIGWILIELGIAHRIENAMLVHIGFWFGLFSLPFAFLLGAIISLVTTLLQREKKVTC